ncbi:MAG: hypothetical protein K8S99_16425 [Planctomycetes bacterium]|nr:hypothetical protein [Planctomycetota bacterium]
MGFVLPGIGECVAAAVVLTVCIVASVLPKRGRLHVIAFLVLVVGVLLQAPMMIIGSLGNPAVHPLFQAMVFLFELGIWVFFPVSLSFLRPTACSCGVNGGGCLSSVSGEPAARGMFPSPRRCLGRMTSCKPAH